jgi:hypothetical protein
MSRLAAVAFVLAACQSGSAKVSGSPPASAPESGSAPPPALAPTADPAPSQELAQLAGDYPADVDRLCNAMKYSGADKQAPGARQMLIAAWLGPNLKTQEIRSFLVHFQTLSTGDKKKALLAEAAKAGLPGCPLADEWK